jgi:hypothetical protein
MKGGDREMKKKLTVGVFLVLAAVLVASIVGVRVADAARPHSITADLDYISNGDGTGNLTLTVSWEKYGAWGYRWMLGNYTPGAGSPDIFANYKIPLNERTTFDSIVVYDESDLPCGRNYWTRFFLYGKNDRPIKHADRIARLTTDDCP